MGGGISESRRPLLSPTTSTDSFTKETLPHPTPGPIFSAKHAATLTIRRLRRTKLRRDFWLSALTSALLLYTYLFHIRPAFHHNYSLSTIFRTPFPIDELEQIVAQEPSAERIKEWSRYYASGPHLGGKNYSQALWTKQKFEEFGFKAEIVTYEIYANYPKDHSLELWTTKKDGGEKKIEFKARLEEDVLKDDPTSGLEDRVPTFHGYSASGNVTGQLVFVNYGTFEDYKLLQERGVDLKGKIVLAKYGGIFRGLKVKRAQELGAVGAILYGDPGDDRNITEKAGHKPYPEGKARNPSSVQRGSVMFLSIAPGDPTTPGYPSLPGAPRVSPEHSTPTIPSLPISYTDAIPLLKALEGHGIEASTLGKTWNTGGLDYKGVRYFTGPTPPEVVVNLVNEVEYEITPMWNVIATIEGELKNEVVLMGNHRDAWIAGGAGDPNSGSACLIEVARTFGVMKKRGWKPLRTIKLASWDGEEYGLLGSTEWVEDKWHYLDKNAVAYLNLDVGAVGKHFDVASNPLLINLVHSATQKVLDPASVAAGQNKTVFDVWGGAYNPLGSGSDFTAFQDFIGIPSVDMSFQTGPDDAVYHYHSNYDSTAWMELHGDPTYTYHHTMTQILLHLTLSLTEPLAIPFSAHTYASYLLTHLTSLKHSTAQLPPPKNNTTLKSFHSFLHSLSHLEHTASTFLTHATRLDAWRQQLLAQLSPKKSYNPLLLPITLRLYSYVHGVNRAYQRLDRAFTDSGGLDGRPVYKHVVYAPGRWTGYEGAVFPGLVESVEDGEWGRGRVWGGRVEACFRRAGKLVRGTEAYRPLNWQDREERMEGGREGGGGEEEVVEGSGDLINDLEREVVKSQ